MVTSADFDCRLVLLARERREARELSREKLDLAKLARDVRDAPCDKLVAASDAACLKFAKPLEIDSPAARSHDRPVFRALLLLWPTIAAKLKALPPLAFSGVLAP